MEDDKKLEVVFILRNHANLSRVIEWLQKQSGLRITSHLSRTVHVNGSVADLKKACNVTLRYIDAAKQYWKCPMPDLEAHGIHAVHGLSHMPVTHIGPQLGINTSTARPRGSGFRIG